MKRAETGHVRAICCESWPSWCEGAVERGWRLRLQKESSSGEFTVPTSQSSADIPPGFPGRGLCLVAVLRRDFRVGERDVGHGLGTSRLAGLAILGDPWGLEKNVWERECFWVFFLLLGSGNMFWVLALG